LKSATDARKERTIEMEVANPFLYHQFTLSIKLGMTHMILSLYLMTTAVINPPKVCVKTVPIAHPLKLLKLPITLSNHPAPAGPVGKTNIGTNAGTREKSESWVFRIHKSGAGPLPPPPFRMNSK
jgi:hypothetical protein